MRHRLRRETDINAYPTQKFTFKLFLASQATDYAGPETFFSIPPLNDHLIAPRGREVLKSLTVQRKDYYLKVSYEGKIHKCEETD